MDNFMFYNPTRIVFGSGSAARLDEILKKHGATKVLLHYGGGSIHKSGAYDAVVKALNKANIPFVELGGVLPNPRLSLVEQGIKIARERAVDFILAVGGGSTIDSAKAIGVGFYNDNMWDELFMPGAPAKQMLPVGVVLTLAATGSESSTSCVITNDRTGYKRGIGGEALLPKFAVLDPTYTYTLPAHQTAFGSCDIMAHLLERYFTRTADVEFTDNLIEAAMKTVLQFAPIAIKTPNDYNARSQLMWAGTIAHNNLLNTGRLGDWASHKIEHELSGRYDIAHGEGLAIIFPAWMRYVLQEDKSEDTAKRFARLARNVFGSGKSGTDAAYDDSNSCNSKLAHKGIELFEEWLTALGLKTRLSQLSITTEGFAEMSKMCLKDRPHVGEYIRLDAAAVEKIYHLAL